MKSFLLSSLSILLAFVTNAQVTFLKTFGTIDDDGAYDICRVDDNGYIICGYTSNYYWGDADIYLIRINDDGDTLWTRTIDHPMEDDYAYSIRETFDRGFIVGGTWGGSGSGVGCLIKLDSLGNTIWLKTYPSGTSIPSVKQTSDSGFVFPGTKYSNNCDAYITKTDRNGEQQWSYTYGYMWYDGGRSVEISSDNKYVICGTESLPPNYFPGFWLCKIDQYGSKYFSMVHGGQDNMEGGIAVKRTRDNGYISSGSYNSSIIVLGGDNTILIRYGKTGNWIWARIFAGYDDNIGYSVDTVSDGGFVMCGYATKYDAGQEDVWVVRTDAQGDTLWTRLIGGVYPDRGYSVVSTKDGGFLICGYTRSFGIGGSDVILIKTDGQGTTTGMDNIDISRDRINIYPNPTSGEFSFSCNKTVSEIRITTPEGKCLYRKCVDLRPGTIEPLTVSDLPAGLYFLVIKTGKGYLAGKIVRL